MREIKFRVWHKRLGEFVPYVVGINFVDKKVTYDRKTLNHEVSFKDCEISQYTGLKDRNETEIYEGDIMLFLAVTQNGYEDYDGNWVDTTKEATPTVVKFKDGYFYLEHQNGEISSFSELRDGEIGLYEVIGNIYENKELLNVREI